jgi:hypothetical protein
LAFHSGREADHSPLSSAEVKEWVELYLHSPNTLHGVVLRRSTGTGSYIPLLLQYVFIACFVTYRNKFVRCNKGKVKR